VRNRGTILRAEERSSDLSASIDAVLDKMYRQVMRYKGKHYRGRPQVREAEEPLEEMEDLELFPDEPRHIVRIKRFPTPPMDEEEAIEQMELLGHDFFVFMNAESGEINVLYRRRDGDYGLIIPEPA
jgi:putative sigma-54 modulation protein